MFKDFLRAPNCTSSEHKCYRFLALIGSLFLVSSLAGCQNPYIRESKSDFLHYDNPISFEYANYVKEEGLGPDWVYGAMIQADLDILQNFI